MQPPMPVETWNPVLLAFLGTLFTWFMTSLGAAAVFVRSEIPRRGLDGMLGFAAGVMLAASYWSLLAPSIELSAGLAGFAWAPAALGFALGGAMVWGADKVLPHLHLFVPKPEREGLEATWERTTLLAAAVALHNVPEGLSIGVAFGSLAHDPTAFAGAAALALGIGVQDLPEGIAVAVPLLGLGTVSKARAFFIGQLSGLLQIVAGVVGALAVSVFVPLLPYALAFAAGAMIFVVLEDVVPEAQARGNVDLMTAFAILGFVVMMALDVGLG